MSSIAPLDIAAAPAANQRITHRGEDYTTIKEGLAHILIPISAASVPQTTPKGENQAQSVFYNPIQQFNRDLSVLAIKAYGEEIQEKKRKYMENNKKKWEQKKKDKKRKREADGLTSDPARKASRLGGESDPAAYSETEISKVNDKASVDHSVVGQEVSKNEVSIKVEHAQEVEAVAEEADRGTTLESGNASVIADPGKTLAAAAVGNQKSDRPPNPTPKPTFRILDALSATGLRALRYAHEIPYTTSVTANDLLAAATDMIKLNVKHNKLDEKITAVTGNALAHMYGLIGEDCRNEKGAAKPSSKYDVIDLDPYGTAAPFLDAAVQSVRDDGGLLCVTCTDAGVWASNGYPEKAFSLYGGVTIKGFHSHEGGLRLILHAIATSAARYGMAIEPLLSLSIDFYARVFVRIHKSPADVKFLAGKTMVVYNCDSGCGAWNTQTIGRNLLKPNKSGKGHFWKHVYATAPSVSEHCEHCGMKTHLAGPMYGGPLHSPDFIKRILSDLPNVSKETYQTTDRIEGMLTLALEEMLPVEEDINSPTLPSKTHKYDPAVLDHHPFFFMPSYLAKIVHCVTPDEDSLRGALRHLGYRVTRSHTKPGSIKTDAPWAVIWEVMREWVRQKAPIKKGAVRKGTAGWKILGLDKEETAEGSSRKSGTTSETIVEDGEKVEANVGGGEKKIDVVFDVKLGKERDAKKLVRYQLNPRENWGPMNRAKG